MNKQLKATFMISLMLIMIVSAMFNVNAVSINEVATNDNDDKGNFGLGFILCTVQYIYFFERETKMAWNVKFELSDYDTGEVIEEKTCLLGIHLFKFLPRGHNYVINVTTPKGSETIGVGNLGFFEYVPMGILILDY